MLSQLAEKVRHAVSADTMRGFRVSERNTFAAGRHGLLRVLEAVEIATGNEVSIFVMSVTEVSQRCSSAKEAFAVLQQVKQSAAALTRSRHPAVLRVVRPLTEESSRIWYATERVHTTLSMLSASDSVDKQEALLGLRHCAEGIQFFHERMGMLLCNFCPDSVFLTANEWKIGDLAHSVDMAQYVKGTFAAPNGFRSASAPLLDYCAPELVEEAERARGQPETTAWALVGGTTVPDLFESSTSSLSSGSGLILPDTDVFSFILVVLRVLERRSILNTAGEVTVYRRILQEGELVAQKWFGQSRGSLLGSVPRPPFSDVLRESVMGSDTLLVLSALGTYSALDPTAKFRLLKCLHDKLKASEVSESVIGKIIIPLMQREFCEVGMKRYVLPLLLLCSKAISQRAFEVQIRPLFVDLLRSLSAFFRHREALGALTPETAAVLAHQILEKRDCLLPHFMSQTDYVSVLLPFQAVTLQLCSSNHSMVPLALSFVQQTLRELATGPAAHSGSSPPSVSTTSGKLQAPAAVTATAADTLTPHLLGVLAAYSQQTTVILEIFALLIPSASEATKANAERQLISILAETSSSVDGGFQPTGDGGSSGERVARLLQAVQSLATYTTREHKARRSIPLLAPLLVANDKSVRTGTRKFLVQLIDNVSELEHTTVEPVRCGPAPRVFPAQQPAPNGASSFFGDQEIPLPLKGGNSDKDVRDVFGF